MSHLTVNTQPVALNPTLTFSITVDSRIGKMKNPLFLFRQSHRVGVSDHHTNTQTQGQGFE
ncbi:hypothetical protein V6Z11_D07G220800 [Gossypium hirsutum]